MVRTKDSALSKEQLGAMGTKMIKGGVARGEGKGEGGKGGKGKMVREGPKIKTLSMADVKINGKVKSLEEIVAAKAEQREAQRQKRKEAIEKRKQEAKEAGENGEEKPKKSRPKKESSGETIKYPKGSGCHNCKKNPGIAGPMIECEDYSCDYKFCRKCLVDKYGLQISDPNDEEKEEESSKSLESLDSDDSMVDEDRVTEKPGVLNAGNTRWKCPVCENICICVKCRKGKGLPPLSNLKDITKAINGKFPNLWTYLIYNRDHTSSNDNLNNNADASDDGDESGDANNNNNNNNQSNSNKNNNNNNDDDLEDVSEEEDFKPKKKPAAKKTKAKPSKRKVIESEDESEDEEKSADSDD